MSESQNTPTYRGSQDLTGRRFDRWTVLAYAGLKGRAACWLCRCDCGTEKTVRAPDLLRGQSHSCGCLRRELARASQRGRTHGRTIEHPKEWAAYCNAHDRCYKTNHKRYADYGGRGVIFDSRWLGKDGFDRFLADMGPRPDGVGLERRDNNGPYSPENCRWATPSEQARNRRTTQRITFCGQTKCIAEWAAEIGIPRQTLHRRLKTGWPVKRALTTPGWSS